MNAEHPNLTSASSSSFYGEESKDPLHKVQDIPPNVQVGTQLPAHIQWVMTLKGDQDFVSVHEWAARLCHILLVETGFFPSTDGGLSSPLTSNSTPTLDGMTPQAAMIMRDVERISHFSCKLSPTVIYSEHGIYALKYKAILCHLVDIPVTETSGDVDVKMRDGVEGGSDKVGVGVGETGQERIPEQEFHYSFSNEINVTMMILEDRLNITATCPMGLERRPISLQFTLNIEEFFTKRVKSLPVQLKAEEWMRTYPVNYTRLSVYFKNKFAILFLDQMDAVIFERRGLFSLPFLVLVKILKKSDVATILRMSRTCTYFYNTARDNRLWKFLFKRDFPNEPPQILSIGAPPPEPHPHPLPGLMAPPPTPAPRSTPNTEPSSPPSHQDDTSQKLRNGEPDYYDIYKQTYASKYRRLLRIRSFPIRFFPTLRIGRRVPSIPFNF